MKTQPPTEADDMPRHAAERIRLKLEAMFAMASKMSVFSHELIVSRFSSEFDSAFPEGSTHRALALQIAKRHGYDYKSAAEFENEAEVDSRKPPTRP